MVAASSLASDATGKGSSVKAELHFLQRSKEYDEIKPYSMRYAPQNEILQTIIKHETKMREIQDMRIFREKLRFQSCGFGVMPFASQMKYADFESLDTIHSVYLGELQAKLKDTFQASYVHVIDTVVQHIFGGLIAVGLTKNMSRCDGGIPISQYPRARSMNISSLQP